MISSESPRELKKLQPLRRWSHEQKIKSFFTVGCVPSTLLDWVNRDEIDTGVRDGITSEERDRRKALERENKELRRANEILKLASVFFCPCRPKGSGFYWRVTSTEPRSEAMTRMVNPPHPGLTPRDEVLPALGLGVTQAAEQLDVSRVALSRVLNGRAAISPEMALRIEAWLGVER